jgi:hypothetical protein
VANGWWLVAGVWLLNFQVLFDDPMSQGNWELSNRATSHQLPATSHHSVELLP